MLDICLLGTGGMLPLPDRYLTAMMARYNGRKLLIDCGEGTQVTMRMLGWGYKTLDVICFTHYHGDHVTGLQVYYLQLIIQVELSHLQLLDLQVFVKW